eukprot:632687-Prymnesium_polylepis.1
MIWERGRPVARAPTQSEQRQDGSLRAHSSQTSNKQRGAFEVCRVRCYCTLKIFVPTDRKRKTPDQIHQLPDIRRAACGPAPGGVNEDPPPMHRIACRCPV